MFSDASNGEFETKSLQYRPIDGLYSKAATFKRTFPEITCPICKIVFRKHSPYNVCNFKYLFIPRKNNLPRIKVRNVNNPLIENQLLVYQEILRESRYVIGKSVYASKGNSKPS